MSDEMAKLKCIEPRETSGFAARLTNALIDECDILKADDEVTQREIVARGLV